jgi:hypothetical protein
MSLLPVYLYIARKNSGLQCICFCAYYRHMDDFDFDVLNDGIDDDLSGTGFVYTNPDGTSEPIPQEELDELFKDEADEPPRVPSTPALPDLPPLPPLPESLKPDPPIPPDPPEYESEYYRQAQRELAAARSDQREAEIEARRIAREEAGKTYTRYLFAPGYRHHRITLIDHDWQKNLYGLPYHDGWWIARCDCGVIMRVKTQWLRQNCRCARCCELCAAKGLARKSRDLRSLKRFDPTSGPPHKKLEGQTIGRLTFIEWVPGIGWICQCETCGGYETYRTSQRAVCRSLVNCDGRCTPEHP